MLVNGSEDQTVEEQKKIEKAFVTQPRTQSKQSHISDNASVMLSTGGPIMNPGKSDLCDPAPLNEA